jgi:hypothetical protein
LIKYKKDNNMDNSKDLNLKAKYEQLYWGEFVAPIKGAY